MTTAKIGVANKPKTATPIKGDTLLVYLVDRSGSMMTCWEDTISGLNADLEVQQGDDDGATEVAFYFFDGERSFTGGQRGSHRKTRVVTAFEGSLSEAVALDVDNETYAPHGSTPLYDSVGRMIEEVQARVDATPDGANVIVSIFTDGGNTDRHGYSPDEVRVMVEEAQGKGWTFSYFGANQDAWEVGGSFGIAAGNTMSYSTDNMVATMATASAARSVHVKGAKMAKAAGHEYTTRSFFSDAGQSEADYRA